MTEPNILNGPPGLFRCIAHRGASGTAPENTLLAIRNAVEMGAHGIEIDVHLVGGELVVIHDRKLDRTTNGRGLITRKTIDHLRSLDAGQGERIPFLQEVFDQVDRRAFINIELKGPGTGPPTAWLIDRFVRQFGWTYDHFLVSSFNRENLVEAIHVSPQLHIGLLQNSIPRTSAIQLFRPYSLHPSLRHATRRLIESAHARGLKVFVYTVNTPEQIAQMRELGADGVFTNFPDRFFSPRL